MRLGSWVAALLLASAAGAQQPARPAPAPAAPRAKDPTNPLEALQQARAAFEFGDHLMVERLLATNAAKIENPALRAEAWRLLGISRFYKQKNDEAAAAFIELLTLEPDEELDPFYVSPRAIAFFDDVKKSAEEALRPIRERKRKEAEDRRREAEEEARKKREREQAEEARRLAALRAPTILERRVVQREFWVSLLPFGIGQMQNGEQNLGTILATSQIIAGATSVGSALLIETLRDRSTGKFNDRDYVIATRLQAAKWIGAGAFYALWFGGAIHAAVKYKPEVVGSELVLPAAAVPGGPPDPKQPRPEPQPPPTAPAPATPPR